MYFSELLKTVIKHGYKVKLINEHECSKAKIFNKYVQHFLSNKQQKNFFFFLFFISTGATRFIAKMQLNQLYGYFGRNQELIITANVNRSELETLLLTRIINNVIEINNETFVVLMSGNLNHDLLRRINNTIDLADYKKLDRNVKSNVTIAYAVTAYAQM